MEHTHNWLYGYSSEYLHTLKDHDPLTTASPMELSRKKEVLSRALESHLEASDIMIHSNRWDSVFVPYIHSAPLLSTAVGEATPQGDAAQAPSSGDRGKCYF